MYFSHKRTSFSSEKSFTKVIPVWTLNANLVFLFLFKLKYVSHVFAGFFCMMVTKTRCSPLFLHSILRMGMEKKKNKNKNENKSTSSTKKKKKMKMYIKSVPLRYVRVSKTLNFTDTHTVHIIIPGVNTITKYIQFNIYALRKCRINIYIYFAICYI